MLTDHKAKKTRRAFKSEGAAMADRAKDLNISVEQLQALVDGIG